MMGSGRYILSADGQRAILEPDLSKWGRWFETSGELRRVGSSEIGDYHVSTVFLAIDHGWGNNAPILWETMVFRNQEGGKVVVDYDRELSRQRCSGTREQAEAMHAEVVAALETKILKPKP